MAFAFGRATPSLRQPPSRCLDNPVPGNIIFSLYCARGEMENRIKAQQLQLFADRTSTRYMRSNQLRMYFSAFAYILMECVRRVGLKGTGYAMAQCDTIRLKLIKIGTVIRTSARRVALSFSQFYPYQDLFRHVLRKLQAVRLDS